MTLLSERNMMTYTHTFGQKIECGSFIFPVNHNFNPPIDL